MEFKYLQDSTVNTNTVKHSFDFNDISQAVCEIPTASASQATPPQTTHAKYDYEPYDSGMRSESAHIELQSTASYEYDVKSPTEQMSRFIHEYSNNINAMFMTNEKTDQIFDLSVRLIEEFTLLCRNLLVNHGVLMLTLCCNLHWILCVISFHPTVPHTNDTKS